MVDGDHLILAVERGDTAVPPWLRALDGAGLRHMRQLIRKPDVAILLAWRATRRFQRNSA